MTFGSLIRRDRNDWYQEMTDLRKMADEMFGRMFSWPATAAALTWAPPAEAYIENGTYHLRLAVPDFDPKQVTIEASGDQLLIRGQKQKDEKTSGRNYLTREVVNETFERTFTLPEGVKSEALAAHYEQGMLQISAPVAARSLPRKIEIHTPEAKPQKVAA